MKNSMPEEFSRIWEFAQATLRTIEECEQVIAVLTSQGNLYFLANQDVLRDGRSEESRFVAQLAEKGDSHLMRLLCLWRDGTLDVPSRHMVLSLIGVHPLNRETEVLLRGDGVYTIRRLGTLLPSSQPSRKT